VAEKVHAKKKVTWLHCEKIQAGKDPKPFKKTMAHYDWLFGVSQTALEDFLDNFPEFNSRSSVFNNIISSGQIRRQADLGRVFQDDFAGLRILTVGRLSLDKGYDLALAALKILRNKGYDVRWYVLGAGQERSNIEKLRSQLDLEDSFVLLGTDLNPYGYMKACHIYVQPSRLEGYCTTSNEARILCKPAVVTDVSGMRQQFQDGMNGLIVDCHADSIAAGIERLICDRELGLRFEQALSELKIDTSDEIHKLYRLMED
jgi:glycosyltransferase involved in cell wall biosynthesis